MVTYELWNPARYIMQSQVCVDCGIRIPKASPGTSSGTRGTKAFFSPDRKAWRCEACMEDASKCDLARETLREAIAKGVRVTEGEDIVVTPSGRVVRGLGRLAFLYHGGLLAQLKVREVSLQEVAEMEGREWERIRPRGVVSCS